MWTDEDFKFCKIDHYYDGNIVEELAMEPERVFHACQEDWEDIQFRRKGDDVHAAKVSAKYGGLIYYDDDKKQIGMFVR